MKWYGYYNYSLNQNLLKKKTNTITKKLRLFANSSLPNLNFSKINLYVPSFWNFFVIQNLKNKNFINFYFYSNIYFFFLPLSKIFSFIQFDKQTNNIVLKFIFNNNFLYLFIDLYKKLLYSFSLVFFKKLKFKGKGYYIFKNIRNTIALQFGYSHLIRVYSFFVSVKFLSKTSVFIFGLNYRDVCNRSFAFFNLRPINVFTGKGIRFTRQIIYKKTGKISSYR